MILRIVLISLAALALSGGAAAAGRTTVVASFYPLAAAAQIVGGAAVEVTNVTPAGSEPHDVELSAGDVGRIRSAGLVLYLGEGFQPAVEHAVEGAKGRALDLSAGLVRGADPHVWLDPLRYARIVTRIGAALGRPQQAAAYVRRLRALDAEYRRGLARCARRELVTSHEAFGYLAARYGLRQVAITGLAPDTEPSPRTLERVVARVRETHATTVFAETLVSPRIADTVARETGARSAVLDPLEGLTQEELSRGQTYLGVMRANLAAIRRGLGCR